jgi:hypothetical protein
MDIQFINGTTGDIGWTRIVFEDGLEFEFQVQRSESEVHVHQRWSEQKEFRLIGVEEIQAP